MNPLEKQFTLVDALASLRPGAEWYCHSPLTLSNVVWQDPEIIIPTKSECDAEIIRLKAEYDSKEYQRLRSPEYPPVTDYLDAVVKGDLAQQQAYIDACLAVKAKYPKPEGV